MAYTPVPGSIVTVWEGGELALAVVIGEEAVLFGGFVEATERLVRRGE